MYSLAIKAPCLYANVGVIFASLSWSSGVLKVAGFRAQLEQTPFRLCSVVVAPGHGSVGPERDLLESLMVALQRAYQTSSDRSGSWRDGSAAWEQAAWRYSNLMHMIVSLLELEHWCARQGVRYRGRSPGNGFSVERHRMQSYTLSH